MPRNESVVLTERLAGVDLFTEATQIADNRFRKLRNYYPPRGSLRILGKRLGSSTYNTSAVSGVNRFDNGIRAWTAATRKLIVAGNRATADRLYVGDDGAGTLAEITGPTALPTSVNWYFRNWPLLGTVYAASGDGSVAIQISSDFATRTDMSVSAGATDAQYGKFLEIFRQRLVTARTATNPQHIYYFDAGSDSVIGATQFWRADQPVTALGKATFGTQANALREMLVVGTETQLYYVAGDVDATLEQVSGSIGCVSPKTLVNTPLGLLFLGADRMVYLIRSVGPPEKVGLRIYPDLLKIPSAQLVDACAVYHNGFYKLAFATTGGSTNTLQYWGDLLPVLAGEDTIDWYGPHDGLAILAFVLLDGPADGLLLYGCQDGAGTVWKLDQASLYQDGAETVVGEIHTKEFAEVTEDAPENKLRQKIWNGFAFGYLKEATGSVGVSAVVDAGASTVSDTLSWSVSGALWNSAIWNTDLWGGSSFTEDVLNWTSRIVGRTVQLQLTHNVAADWKLRDFTRKVRVIPRMP